MKTIADLEAALTRAQAALAAASPTGGDRATVRLSGTALRQHHARTDAQMRRYIQAEDAVKRAEWRLHLARAREHRTPRPVPVMPDVKVGDVVYSTITGAPIVVAKVNAKSIVSTGGVRYGAGEFEVTA